MDVIQKLLDKARQPTGIHPDSPDADLLTGLADELENALHKLEIADQKYLLEHSRATGWFESYARQRDQKIELLAIINKIKDLLSDDEDERTKELRRAVLDTIATGLAGEIMTSSIPVQSDDPETTLPES